MIDSLPHVLQPPGVATRTTILVVDNDTADVAGVAHALDVAGYDTYVIHNGAAALDLAQEMTPDLVVLELGLAGGLDGMSVLRRLRMDNWRTRVLVHSNQCDADARVLALRAGADGYVTKPVSMVELLARVEALWRRVRPAEILPRASRDLVIDVGARIVRRRGRPIELTPREFDILYILARNAPHIVSRAKLASSALDGPRDIFTRSADSHILRLRRKLEWDPMRPRHILTVHQAGYRFVP